MHSYVGAYSLAREGASTAVVASETFTVASGVNGTPAELIHVLGSQSPQSGPVTVVSVTDETGTPLSYGVSELGTGAAHVAVTVAATGPVTLTPEGTPVHTVVVSWRQSGALVSGTPYFEYRRWITYPGTTPGTATTQWQSTIDVTRSLAAYTYNIGGGTDCLVDGPRVVAATGIAADESTGFTVGFTSEVFSEPGRILLYGGAGEALLPRIDVSIPLMIVSVAIAFSAVYRFFLPAGRRRRDSSPEIIIPEYLPPKGINVMELAHLLGHARQAIPAQILKLAVAGNVKILDRATRRTRVGFALQLVSQENVDRFERGILVDIFGANATPGAIVEFTPGNLRLRNALMDGSAAAMVAARPNGWRVSAGWAQWVRLTAAVLCGLLAIGNLFAGAMTGALVAMTSGAMNWLPLVALGVALVATMLCALTIRLAGPLTEAGHAMVVYARGLRMYLSLAERERMRVLQSPSGAERSDGAAATRVIELNETLLPYAVLWEVENEWMRVLTSGNSEQVLLPPWLASKRGLFWLGLRNRLPAGFLQFSSDSGPRNTLVWSQHTGSWTYGDGSVDEHLRPKDPGR